MHKYICFPTLLVCAVGVSILASPGIGAGLDDGLIGRWTFDDPANLGKDSASTNNGAVAGGAFSFASARVGAGALAVNGTDGHIAVPDAAGLRFTAAQSYTLSAWIQTASIAGGWRGLVTKSRDQAPFYGLWLDGSGQAIGGQNNITGSAVAEGWHHLAVVQDSDAGTRDLYMDGAVAASGAPIDANGAGQLWIGGAAGVAEFFNGLIDDARLYNRSLTSDEIIELANAPEPTSTLPLAMVSQPLDFLGSPGDKARFAARANAMDLTCQWYKGSAPVGAAIQATFNNGGAEASFTTDALTQADNGAVYRRVFSNASGSITSRVASVTLLTPAFSPGFLKKELYYDIAGTTIADLTLDPKFPESPDDTGLVSLFEAPSSIRDYYGQRLSGFITPSDTGNYIFYLSGDDNAKLYLSTDDAPANKQLIASEPDWNPADIGLEPIEGIRDAPENVSAPVQLESGKKYYVEVLHKESSGGDGLAVTAVKQGDPAPQNGSSPLGGAFIGAIATPTGQTISITNQPADVITNELAQVVFSAGAAASGSGPLAYQWQKNGTNIFKAIEATYTLPQVAAADNDSTYACVVYLPGSVSLKTREAVLKIDLDKTPPSATGVFCPQAQSATTGNQIYIAFDETVDPGTAGNTANYSLSPSKAITDATLQTDGKTVVLTTADLAAGVNYQLTIKNVTDRSAARNRINDTVKPFQVSDLIVHYTFDDQARLGADSAGLNSASVFGGASFTDICRVGTGALQLDGASGHLTAPNNPLIQFAGADSFTVAVWFQAQPNTGWGGIVTKSRSNGSWYGIWRNPDLPRIFTGSAEVWPPTEPLLPDGDWHHAAIVQDGPYGVYKLYVDGVDQNVITQTALPDTGPGDLWIGAADNGEYFKGLIDDVRIYNRPLSESEVQALANAAQPAPKVTLKITRSGGSIQVTWPASATGFSLQSTDHLASGVWQTVGQSPVIQGDQNLVEIAIGGQNRFYRLKK